ncbi:MAG: type II toxin-antitoxin system RelB/DinJ family antitoxin [Oscillospiraceae bacterium]|nr:type II toxin-antitoxin system RelB/DinJ family antitoxin [Oscillospiraceae bacterium]
MQSSNATFNFSLDKQICNRADTLYQSMGLSLSSAINLFLTQSVIQGRLPINNIIAEPVYAHAEELLKDAAEIDNAIADGTAKIHHNLEELFASWRSDDE